MFWWRLVQGRLGGVRWWTRNLPSFPPAWEIPYTPEISSIGLTLLYLGLGAEMALAPVGCGIDLVGLRLAGIVVRLNTQTLLGPSGKTGQVRIL